MSTIHPNFASQPVLCEKMFLCCFFPYKQGLDTQAQKFLPPPCSSLLKQCWIWMHMNTLCWTAKNCVSFSIIWGHRGGGGGGVVDYHACVSCFSSTQEHLFTLDGLACEVLVDSDIFENSTLNVAYAIVAQSHPISTPLQPSKC